MGTDTHAIPVTPLFALTATGREQPAAWTTAHEHRMDAALAALDDADRAAIANALPAPLQLAERLGEPKDAATER